MSNPTGRECTEGDCQWLAPKRGAPAATSDREPGDYECIGKPSYWSDCPRTIRWRLAEVERLGDALAEELRVADTSENAGCTDAAIAAWEARAK